ncbi:Hydrogenase maturation factor HypD [bioreactor metagenome]|uniref:Hydrogenase maturation factor HypD n=1 Tax=bioreactor metagenome TaxID=1076179 RepID=A0A645J286_9ZZZZ
MGSIPISALVIKDKYRELNAIDKFGLRENNLDNSNISGCKCSEVIMGKTTPYECSFFRKVCNSENPIGPCMVSMEGACYCAYKFGR